MKPSILLLLLSACAPSILPAQTPADSIGPLGSVHLAIGGFFAGAQPLYLHDVARITEGSALLATDLSDHDYYGDDYRTGAPLFEASLGLLPFRHEGRRGPELRLGLLYAGRNPRSAYLQRTTFTPYDTLTSSQTGEEVYVDSVHRSTYWIDHSAERFGLSTSLVWRTSGRWSVYGGVGLAGGLLMNVRTEVYHDVYDYVEGPFAVGMPYPYTSREISYTGEVFNNGSGWWLSFSLPFGLDFQMARKSAFWSRMHLFMEFAPQLLFEGEPDLGTSTAFGIRNSFGVRFTL